MDNSNLEKKDAIQARSKFLLGKVDDPAEAAIAPKPEEKPKVITKTQERKDQREQKTKLKEKQARFEERKAGKTNERELEAAQRTLFVRNVGWDTT